MIHPTERTIFLEAIEKDDPAERRRFVEEACGDDEALKASVQALLAADDEDDNPLDRPPVDYRKITETVASPAEWIGNRIGGYRLMEQIGEGGFGLVFVAQQDQPVRRQVALKIVKPGMGTKEVIARFEAEKQAVAMMDHPNIARVFDAGVSEDGRPFFVMELVRGVPVTEFADAHRLTVRERLELFVDVCKAVHHAHQKAVIHRDIKPSNVLVTLHDDRPVVKVIDFGVAKAIGQSLTDKTIYTQFFSMIGTPLYMSPEQAEMSGLDVDTRSDIFSLGVLMYELLSGATPFDRDRLDSAGLDEMRRIIREEEPPAPSRRLSTLGGRMTTVSSSRQVEPSRLTSTLRGDLDWIVMKSLEKDRNRRYDSAMALADDTQRYLNQEPIKARPPSTSYRLMKSASRHRVALGTTALVLLSLIVGLVASLWQMQRVADERDQKEAALEEIELFSQRVTRANELVASGEALAQADQNQAARRAFDEAVTEQPSYYLPWVSRGQFFARQRDYAAAADNFAKALKLGSPTETPQWWGVPALLHLADETEALESYFKQYRKQLITIDDDASLEAIRWEWIRNGVQVDGRLSEQQYDKLARLAEKKLSEPGHDSDRGPGRGFGPSPPPARSDGRPPRDPPPPNFGGAVPRPVQLHIVGLANLRAGRYERAIEYLRDAQTRPHWPSPFITHAPLAIAYAGLGNMDFAKQERQKATKVSQRTNRSTDIKSDFQGTPWFDLVEMQFLPAEAERKISTEN